MSGSCKHTQAPGPSNFTSELPGKRPDFICKGPLAAQHRNAPCSSCSSSVGSQAISFPNRVPLLLPQACRWNGVRGCSPAPTACRRCHAESRKQLHPIAASALVPYVSLPSQQSKHVSVWIQLEEKRVSYRKGGQLRMDGALCNKRGASSRWPWAIHFHPVYRCRDQG